MTSRSKITRRKESPVLLSIACRKSWMGRLHSLRRRVFFVVSSLELVYSWVYAVVAIAWVAFVYHEGDLHADGV